MDAGIMLAGLHTTLQQDSGSEESGQHFQAWCYGSFVRKHSQLEIQEEQMCYWKRDFRAHAQPALDCQQTKTQPVISYLAQALLPVSSMKLWCLAECFAAAAAQRLNSKEEKTMQSGFQMYALPRLWVEDCDLINSPTTRRHA
eukprot:970697-Pelagomonas_calceolata.AAC.1